MRIHFGAKRNRISLSAGKQQPMQGIQQWNGNEHNYYPAMYATENTAAETVLACIVA